ncbi:septum formation initiator family protein [Paenibacillus lycopersici]|jgi:cell division protein DivIC|uniref:Septum formation initiator family protein n=1 Tax=Paenibacillus lycopersici TaxID=2704462 RepID=A0A6C0FNI8_9BACL|nr:septum formation initiator family protein [Paenibacillus lycopersici]QHT58706.1 septum formation initiator family protein [Paenibacillus lycopersici]
MATANANASSARTGTKRRLKIWLMFVLLFMGWALYTFITQLEHQGKAEQKLAAAQSKLNEAAQKTEDLKLEVKRLNDPEYISLKATQELGMVKKGERPIEVLQQP